MFYKDMEKGFQFAFSSAINAYRRGSTTIGCAIMDDLKLKLPHVQKTMSMYQNICDAGVQLGNKLFNDNEFHKLINSPGYRVSSETLIDYMFSYTK
jgi:hypothetical protein